LPVLLVDGDPQLDAAASETFFAKAALTASGNDTPWVRATVVPWDQLNADQLNRAEVVVLANVPRFTEAQAAALKDFTSRGGGLLFALGDKVDAAFYNRLLYEQGEGVLPASLDVVTKDSINPTEGARVVNASLELPWMSRFRAEHDGGFTEARFIQWWKATLATAPSADDAPPGATSSASANSEANGSGTPPGPLAKPVAPDMALAKPVASAVPVVAARLAGGDPLLIVRRFGRGGVVVMTSALDADWSTFPAKPDYVSLLHELIFHLAAGKTARNVEVGTPLVLPIPSDLELAEHAFFGPGGTEFPPQPAGDEARPLVRLDDTRLPGVYTFKRKGNAPASAPVADAPGSPAGEQFVVDFDRGESDLRPLDEAQRALLSKDNRSAFLKTLDEFKQQMFTDTSRTEFWHVLLLLFLAILVGEVVMTRRLVKGGHAVLDTEEETAASSEEPLASRD
jgi:hypothetical protein